jgi:hydroxyacylglutathione hydrolase
MGWFVSYDEPFILLAEESKLDDLTRKLMRIGLDQIQGYVPSTDEWVASGGKLEKASILSTEEFENILRTNHTQILDLRGAAEYKAGHIKGTENLFVGSLPANLDKVRKDQQVVIHCQAGDRAAIGYSILAKYGYKNVKNYSGGMKDWINAGNAVIKEN